MIEWLIEAIHDLQALRDYITYDNPLAAQQIAERIFKAVNPLIEQPHMGRQGRVPNTRELVIPKTSYIVPYRVKNNTIEILRVFHGAMQWP